MCLVVAKSAESILMTGGKLIAATMMLHTGGFFVTVSATSRCIHSLGW